MGGMGTRGDSCETTGMDNDLDGQSEGRWG